MPAFAGMTPEYSQAPCQFPSVEAHACIRRARPLLGTFVEIVAAGAPIPDMEAAVEAAFDSVATVHRLMSFHEAASDVSRLNREAWSRAIQVHDWTYQVLETALDLNRRSEGIFDVAVAPALQELGMLPHAFGSPSPPPSLRGEGRGEGDSPQAQTSGPDTPSGPLTRNLREEHANSNPRSSRGQALSRQAGRGEDRGRRQPPGGVGAPIDLLPENRVRFAHRSVRIDLGGIAKGFAVDRAIEALRRRGVTDGLVNAGGDLAAFGRRSHQVDVRNPRYPNRTMCRIALSNAALASSAGRFDPLRSALASAAVVDPLTGRPAHTISGATVCAPNCVIADALTKVVMNTGEGASALLQHYDANALFVSVQGCVHVTTNWNKEVRFAG